MFKNNSSNYNSIQNNVNTENNIWNKYVYDKLCPQKLS